MLLSFKRKRIERERQEAVDEREEAARDFVAALREAEAALLALRGANDRFYRSEDQLTQLSLTELRRSRERMFSFIASKEVAAEAPTLARLLGIKASSVQCMPFIDFITQTSGSDLSAAGDTRKAITS